MRIGAITTETRSNADRMREFRSARGKEINANRWGKIPEFIAVDSEGIGKGEEHRNVLLSVGTQSYTARDMQAGLQWHEVFEFIWKQYQANKRAAFVGFSLGYDLNMWLATLTREKAHMLLTKEGRFKRKIRHRVGRQIHFPVRVPLPEGISSSYTFYGWEIDMLAFKALTIKPMVCDCYMREKWAVKCPHQKEKAKVKKVTICDVFSFFQSAFLNVIDPENWADDPDGWPITQEEYDIIQEGKSDLRLNATKIDADFIRYNVTENIALSRVMGRLAQGLWDIGIHVNKDKWYGPGATAEAWLKKNSTKTAAQSVSSYPDLKWVLPIAKASYYGGWFEIFSHGLIQGESFNYDINSAYPYAISKLPCLCGKWRHGQGVPPQSGNQDFILCYAKINSYGKRIGAMPFRRKDFSIIRPKATTGWYWAEEIVAAADAGLIDSITITEWVQYLPCDHEPPFKDIERIYYDRLKAGKNSAKGLAIKLTINSIYGKFAQTVGKAPYNNWFYASWITSHCRTQILDAIGSHQAGVQAVLMVATDGIIFDEPHEEFDAEIDKFVADHPRDLFGRENKKDYRLGEWERKVYRNLRIFKPGVYWDDEGLKKVHKIKARGIPKKHFVDSVEPAEYIFGEWILQKKFDITTDDLPDHIRDEFNWPQIWTQIDFSFTSCSQALQGAPELWSHAGEVKEPWHIVQCANPTIDDGLKGKRQNPHWNPHRGRIDTDLIDEDVLESTPYDPGIAPPADFKYEYFTLDGSLLDSFTEMMQAMR
jgi:DNA polymerase type B, organellar and viral